MHLRKQLFDMLHYMQLSNTGKETLAKFFGIDVEFLDSILLSHVGVTYTQYRMTHSMHCKATGFRRLAMSEVVGINSVIPDNVVQVLKNRNLEVDTVPDTLVMFDDGVGLICGGVYSARKANLLLSPAEAFMVSGGSLSVVNASVLVALANGVRKYSYSSIEALKSKTYRLDFFNYCMIPARFNTTALAVAYLAKRFSLPITVADVKPAVAKSGYLELYGNGGRWDGYAKIQFSGTM